MTIKGKVKMELLSCEERVAQQWWGWPMICNWSSCLPIRKVIQSKTSAQWDWVYPGSPPIQHKLKDWEIWLIKLWSSLTCEQIMWISCCKKVAKDSSHPKYDKRRKKISIGCGWQDHRAVARLHPRMPAVSWSKVYPFLISNKVFERPRKNLKSSQWPWENNTY